MDAPLLDLRQLAALRAVADHGSVAKAARALRWSQPTVAHHLRTLAALVGAAVIRTSPGGTALTATGRELDQHGAVLLERAMRALSSAQAYARDHHRRISLGIFPSAAARLLPRLVRAMQTAGYELDVSEAEVGQLQRSIHDLRLDAAVIFSHLDAPRSAMRHALFSERLSILVPDGHPLADATDARLGDFRDDSWVVGADPDDPVESALSAAAGRAGFEPRVRARTDDYSVVAAYVRDGFGVALVPELARPPEGTGVTTVRISDDGLRRSVDLVAAPALPAPALSALLEALRG